FRRLPGAADAVTRPAKVTSTERAFAAPRLSQSVKAAGALTIPFEKKVTVASGVASVNVEPVAIAGTVVAGAVVPGAVLRTIQPCAHEPAEPLQVRPSLDGHTETLTSCFRASLRARLRLIHRVFACVDCLSFCTKLRIAGTA